MEIDLAAEGVGPFLPTQYEGFSFEPPPGHMATIGFFGGWGSGKTNGAGRRFVKEIALAPYTSAYGRNRPKSIVMAPSYPALHETTLPQLMEVLPQELILQDRGPPNNDMMLANGHRILKRSGEAEIEGDAVQIWYDEVHKDVWSKHPRRYLQGVSRLRDKRAPRKTVIASGLPEQGWVRNTFDKEGPGRKTILMSTFDNPFIDRKLLNGFLEACPSGHERSLLYGRWMLMAGAIYSMFNAQIHCVMSQGLEETPVHLGIDLGDRSAVAIFKPYPIVTQDIIGTKTPALGLLMVDELIGDDIGADALCYRIKTETPWVVLAGHSVICVDPTASKDELAAIRKHFPKVRIVKRKKGHVCHPVENGILMVQRALRDALQNVRLFFWEGLLRNGPRGVMSGIERYHRDPNTGRIIKDNAIDHIMDAVRYVVCEMLRSIRPKSRVLR